MCARDKQTVNTLATIVSAFAVLCGGALAGDARLGAAAGIAVGEGVGGVTDHAWVTAPPHYGYIVEKERGSFLDCGAGQDARVADLDGRDMAPLNCGVTLTETIVIPAAAASAKVTIHF